MANWRRYKVNKPDAIKPFPGREEALDRALKQKGEEIKWPQYVKATSSEGACTRLGCRLDGALGFSKDERTVWGVESFPGTVELVTARKAATQTKKPEATQLRLDLELLPLGMLLD